MNRTDIIIWLLKKTFFVQLNEEININKEFIIFKLILFLFSFFDKKVYNLPINIYNIKKINQ